MSSTSFAENWMGAFDLDPSVKASLALILKPEALNFG
jgi:hypothetical protein